MTDAADETPPGRTSARLPLTVLTAINLSVVVWHGGAHSALAVALSPLQNLFVFGVILFVPVLATLLLWTRLEEFALWVYMIAMCASLLFGVFYHYIVMSPDNIHYLPPAGDSARHRFTYSAAAVAVTEAVAVIRSALALLAAQPAIQT
jgi:hypothetical protein